MDESLRGKAHTAKQEHNNNVVALKPKPELPRFEATDAGVFFVEEDGKTWICDKLLITAQACNENEEGWGKLLEFTDPAGNNHCWAMPLRLLAGNGDEMRGELLSLGLNIAPGRKARDLLTCYIQRSKPKELARSVERTGWYKGVFVLPDEQIGSLENERVLLQTGSATKVATYDQAGTLEEWQRKGSSLLTTYQF